MTAPAPETLEREKDKLYLLDSELIRRLGVPEIIAQHRNPIDFVGLSASSAGNKFSR